MVAAPRPDAVKKALKFAKEKEGWNQMVELIKTNCVVGK